MKSVFLVLLIGMNAWAQNEVLDIEARVTSKIENIKSLFVGFDIRTATQQQKTTLHDQIRTLATEIGLRGQDLWNLSRTSGRKNDDFMILIGTALALENKLFDESSSTVFDFPAIKVALDGALRAPYLKGDIRQYIRDISEGKNVEQTRAQMRNVLKRIVSASDAVVDSREIRTLEGEYFSNAEVKIDEIDGRVNSDRASHMGAEVALKFCQEKGFNFRTAFFWERKGKDLVLSDVFCSNNFYHNNTDGRSVIMNSRRNRGLPITQEGKKIVDIYRRISLKGYKQTSLIPSDSRSLGQTQPVSTGKP